MYTDSGLWSDDVAAATSTLGLDRPVLVGWSYGGLVICDYLRFHPDTPLQGIEFVCPWTTLGTPAAQQEISSAVFALVPGLTSNTVGTAVAAVSDLIGLAFEKPLAAEPHFRTLGFNLVVPPDVRADLLDRTLDNNDVLAQLQVPVLVTQGAKDRILAPEASRQLAERIPGATLSVYPAAGACPVRRQPRPLRPRAAPLRARRIALAPARPRWRRPQAPAQPPRSASRSPVCGTPGRGSCGVTPVTGPADTAGLIDRMRADGLVLTYDPDDQTLRAGSLDAPPVTVGNNH